MRIWVVLLGALLLSGIVPAEASASRPEGRSVSAGKAQASPARAAAPARSAAPRREAARPAAPREAAAARAAGTRQAAARGTTRQAASAAATRQAAARGTAARQAAACARRDARGRCVQPVGPRSVAWHGGLPEASGEQAIGCPTGTIAILARGHADVVRCLPI